MFKYSMKEKEIAFRNDTFNSMKLNSRIINVVKNSILSDFVFNRVHTSTVVRPLRHKGLPYTCTLCQTRH